jgi:hypothetical protein
MHPSFRCLLFSAAAIAAVTSALGQSQISFTNRLDNIDNWFSSSGASSSGMSLANGTLSVSTELGGRHVLTFFTPAGTQQSLNLNDTFQAKFDLSFTKVGTGGGSFRVGIFNSTGTLSEPNRPTGSGDPQYFAPFKGYLTSWNPKPDPSSATNGLGVRERNTTTSTDLLSTTTVYSGTLPGTGSPSGKQFAAGTTYSAAYSISRTANSELTISFSITGSGLGTFSRTVTDSTPSTYAFDSFGLYALSGSSNFAISNLVFSYDPAISAFDLGGPAIPEPSTYAACAGAAVLGLAFWRRRRAAAKALVA